MKTRKHSTERKGHPADVAAKKKSARVSKLSRIARGALLAVGLTAAQLSDEADFFGDKVFKRNLVDRLHSTALTRYHE